ncbi:GTP cyclohydrolase I type 2 [Obesumbacterium proteus ATCC 12841]|uniref:GTP cyclohydrolase FolE2 n=2 Tax=Obesumbacterium proteus TaxID=82983 RepID=A0AA91EDY0_9GAMM|nr:GTP cyclohydrolase I type 2 [Obesumbacterium proteus ATCC 12841]
MVGTPEGPLADAQAMKDKASNIGLDWVGMEGIALPVEISGRPVSAFVNAGINLISRDEGQKGIHMSRLYQGLDELTQGELTPQRIEKTLNHFLSSHEGQTSQANMRVSGDILLSRSSMLSGNRGWKAYPLEIDATLADSLILTLKIGVPYSSTCPSSAALSVQVAQQQFNLDFDSHGDSVSQKDVSKWLIERGLPATPHSQRSWAWITVRLGLNASQFPVIELINRIEVALSTPVQTVVKRNDEQAFAIANGQNLMFCEDAARRLYNALKNQCHFDRVDIQVEHQESLHAHNAVARTSWKRGFYAA